MLLAAYSKEPKWHMPFYNLYFIILQAFLHVSTAYSFCPRKVIDEEIYEPGLKGEDLMNMVESINQEKLAAITPS